MPTTRERIAEILRGQALSPSALSEAVDTTPDDAIEHVRHVARSLEGTEEDLLVAPPRCRDCGFDGFDDLANRPSRCPECKSEAIEEPTFTIHDEG